MAGHLEYWICEATTTEFLRAEVIESIHRKTAPVRHAIACKTSLGESSHSRVSAISRRPTSFVRLDAR
jgi:hypothetical protein